MKRSRLLLPSLALNAVLLLALGWLLRPFGSPSLTAPVAAPAGSPEAADQPAALASKAASFKDPSLAPFALEAIHWSRFTVGDWKRYRDELVASGCPRPTVRAIIAPLVERHFMRRGRELMAPISARFWEFLCPPAKERMEKVEQQMSALQHERRSVLEQLFPAGWPADEPAQAGVPDERTAFLDPAKREAVAAAEQEHNEWDEEADRIQPDRELRHQLYSEANAKLEAELARILSPAELAEFKARDSNAARSIRNLEGVQLTATEMAEMVRIEEQGGAGEPTDAAKAAKREAALKQLLGPERFQELERARDGKYQELATLARRLGLPPEVAHALWQTQRTLQEQAAALAKDSTLPRDQRRAALRDLRQQQEQAASHLLPNAGSRETWERQQGNWLKETFTVPEADPIAEWFKEP